MELALTALITGLACAAGNYIWQLLKDRDWEEAWERTFFQSIALTILWITVSTK